MKRFIHFTLVLALILGFVSCKKDEILNTAKETTKDAPVVKNLPPKQKITLSASSKKPCLRVAYDASKGTDVTDDNTLWQEGDQIAVYNVGVNGSPVTFTLVDGAGTSYGTFEGEIEPTGNYYGIYPLSAAGALDGTSIAITLPASQNYAEGSFGQNAAVFAATSTSVGSDVVLNFEPLLGYLSLSLTTLPNTSRDAESRVGGHSVGSIVLHENSLGGMSLSGAATVDMSSTPQLVSSPTGGGLDVTLNCGGVQLGSTPKEFIIAVPAGAFSKGLCATVNGTDGKKIMSLATTTPNVIEVNYITKLPEQAVFNVEDVEGRRYPVAEIVYEGREYFWTAENMKCLTYDTKSGCTDITIVEKSKETDFGPRYIDPSKDAYWDPEDVYIKDPSDLNEVSSQKSRFGYMYTWAATVGLKDDEAAYAQVEDFDGHRQGICPNGWHVPDLWTYYLDLQNSVLVQAEDWVGGRLLKSVDGWSKYDYETGNFDQGTEDFGFSLLPVGFYTANDYILEFGGVAFFWTTTPVGDPYGTDPRHMVWGFYVHNDDPDMYFNRHMSKATCLSVRCLKDY